MTATPASLPILRGDMLDFYLAQGYYRMHQDLFTCRFLPLQDSLYSVHWLRVVLAEVAFGPEQRRLLRLNERFSTRIRPFRLTAEYEDLFARYRASVTFDAPETVEAFLLAGYAHNVFPTEVVEVHDGSRLVAVGIFDRGEQSLAGIMNFYDPEYRKYSLGKFLMLFKLTHARQHLLRYYYPGYVVHRYPKFDYKLFACPAATEVFDAATGHWLPFSWDTVAAHSADLLRDWQEPDAAGAERASS